MGHNNNKQPINCGGCVCLTVILVVIATIAFGIMTIVISSTTYGYNNYRVYTTSGSLHSSPHGAILTSTGLLTMTISFPKDFVSAVPYTISDGSGHAHTITLPTGTTFDGGYTTATFDSVKGSTLSFVVVSATRIHIISKYGVTIN